MRTVPDDPEELDEPLLLDPALDPELELEPALPLELRPRSSGLTDRDAPDTPAPPWL